MEISLTPTRIADPPPDPTEIEGYTPDQIKDQIEQMTETQEQADALKAQAKEEKQKLKDMIAGVQISNADFKSWIFDTYWNTEGTAVILQALVKRRLGDAHRTWKSIIEGSVDWPCSKCQAVVKRTFGSKSAFSGAKSKRYPFLCPTCQSARTCEMEKQNAAQEARWEQRDQRSAELRSMPYPEYLQTPEWNETRKTMLKRARYTCQTCNAQNVTLHVHHRTYERLGAEYNKDLIVLCADCHAKIHDKEPRNGA